jgi:hypothetical protein
MISTGPEAMMHQRISHRSSQIDAQLHISYDFYPRATQLQSIRDPTNRADHQIVFLHHV